MSKQRKQRRKQMEIEEQDRRAGAKPREQTRWRGNQQELAEAVKKGQVTLEVQPDSTPSPTVKPRAQKTAQRPATPAASSATPTSPRPSKRTATAEPAPEPIPAKEERAPFTRAGTQQYDEFFRLYSLVVKSTIRCSSLLEALAGKRQGLYFLSLGFIPGPAALLQFRRDQVQVVEATPDVKSGMTIPTPWIKVAELPEKIRQPLERWHSIVEVLGYESSPWNMGFASRLLGGHDDFSYLCMVMPRFRYRSGDPERSFGIILVPGEHEDTMEVERVYNPQSIPEVPAEGAVLTLEELKGKGPVQKLLRTWALMETNYWSRYDRYGQPRPPRR